MKKKYAPESLCDVGTVVLFVSGYDEFGLPILMFRRVKGTYLIDVCGGKKKWFIILNKPLPDNRTGISVDDVVGYVSKTFHNVDCFFSWMTRNINLFDKKMRKTINIYNKS
jgi:hypothetical protein